MKRSHILSAIFLATIIFSRTAQAASLIWTNGSGNFATASNWSPAQSPGVVDNTQFTNDTAYTVSFTASITQVNSNFFNGHTGVVTLDIGSGNAWTITNQQIGAGLGGIVVGQAAGTTAIVQMISGSLNATGITGAADIKIGGNGQGTFTVTNGTVRNNTTIIGDTATGRGTLTISGPNTVWTNGGQSATFNVGSVSSGNSMTLSNGAQLLTGNGTIGISTTSATNKVLITDANSTWLSSAGITVIGTVNSLTVSNGGQVLSSSGTLGTAVGTSNNTVVITGSSSIWSNNTFTLAGPSNQLSIINGGKMLSSSGTIGSGNAGSNTLVVLTDAGSVWSNSGTIVVGGGANVNNNLTVSNGAALYAGYLFDDNSGSSKSNAVNFGGLGAASSVTITGNFQVGNNAAATFGLLTITNATVNSGTFNFGGGAGTNHIASVLAGATWNLTAKRFAAVGFFGTMTADSAVITNVGDFIWGNAGSVLFGNALTITDGAKLFTGVAGSIWDIGRGVGVYSNTVLVTGNGSAWDAGTRIVDIGDVSTSNNTLTVTAGGVFTNGSLLVGNGATNNLLVIAGGKIAVTNLSVTISNLITFTSGTLNTGGTVIQSGANGGATLVVGDGVNAASLELAVGGTGYHTFGSGLVITNNATLRGVGTIIGTTTILGTLAPGFSPGTITTSNDVTLGSSAVMNYDLAAPGSSDLMAVNGSLTLGGTLNLNDVGGFTNGIYTLFTYTGALTYNTPSIGTTPNAGLYYAISTSTVGQVNLQVTFTAPAGPITGSASVNTGDSGVSYSISSVSGATTYTWTVPAGATITGGQGTTSITVNYGCSAISGSVTVTPSNVNGSGASSSLGVTIVEVGAAGGISGSTTVCQGQTGVAYSISGVGGATIYTWTAPSGATITGGQGTTSITVDYSGSAVSGSVTVTPANANSCAGTGSNLAITVNTPPSVSVGPSPQTVCVGGTAGFSVTASGTGLNYQWRENGSTLSDGGTISGSGTSSLTVSNAAPGDSGASFDCVVSGTCSPAATSSAAVLTVNPASVGGTAAATVSSVCNGDATTITLVGNVGLIQWQSSLDNATYANITDATNATVSTGALVTNTYYRAVITSSPCSAATSSVAEVTINVTAPSISAAPVSTNVCAGSTATFTVAATGNGPLSYMWRKRGTGWGQGWTLNNGGGGFFTSASTGNDNFQPSSNGGNDIDTSGRSWGMYNTSGGVTEALRLFSTALGVDQTFALDMDNGASVVGTVGFGLQDSSSGLNRVEIYFVGGRGDYTINDANGEHDSGIPFTWAGINVLVRLTSSTTYAVTITRYIDGQSASFAGTLSNAGAVDRVRLFDANGAGGSANDLYFNSVRVASADDNAADAAYNSGWNGGSDGGQKPLVNGGDVAGAGTSTLTISPAALGDSGAYDVSVSDACGLVTISNAATLTVNPNPTVFNVTGGGAYCAGGSGVAVGLDGSESGVNYQLLLGGNPSGAPLAGTGSALSFSNQTAAGNYTVAAANGTTGCGSAMNGTATVTINPTPSCVVNPASATICAGGSQMFTVTPSGGTPGYTYLWSTAATTSNITASAGGTYTVTVTDANGCTTTCSATLTVNPTPSCAVTPSSAAICAGGSQTFTVNPSGGTPGYTYLWSDGSTGASLSTNAAGTYSVTVTDANGCMTTCNGTLTVNPLPGVFNMTGGGAYCTIGVAVGLDGSESGVSYQLLLGGNPTGSPVAGTGGAITFGNQTAAGSYTATASNTTTGCTSAMAGSATVTLTDPFQCWQLLYFGCTNCPQADATADPDGDGQNNQAEYLAGTIPTNSTSVLRVTAITRSGMDITITWSTAGGHTNMLQVTGGTVNGSYNTNNFVDIAGSLTVIGGSGDTSTNYVDVGGATNAPSRYYRVRLVP